MTNQPQLAGSTVDPTTRKKHRMPSKHISRIRFGFAAVFAVLAIFRAASMPLHAAETTPATPQFERDVLPILTRHCLECHGGKAKKSGLDLHDAASILLGGQDGAAVIAGAADKSLLIERVSDGSMPPEGHAPMPAGEVQVLRDWINSLAASEGPAVAVPTRELSAEDAAYWAFQPLARPPVPGVSSSQRVRTPIDAFILSRLEAQKLGLSPDADRLALLRRLHFDLTGLPPTLAEIDAWLADRSPDAYERLVERLLSSPHYGERWGRHWLDAAGYADTIKTDNDINGAAIRDGMWRYRDYVVRSFNADKPYDQFVREQLSGDEMTGVTGWDKFPAESITPEMQELLTATGLLRTAVDGTNNFERNRPLERFEVLFDTIENLSSNLLGLTVACARCHDHKFDPITQKDYYGLMACLTPSYNPAAWVQPQNRHIVVSTVAELAEITAVNKDLDKQAGALGGPLAKIRRPVEQRLFESRLAALPEAIREDVRVALKTNDSKRTEVQKYLFERFDAGLKVSREDVAQALTDEDRATAERLDREIDDLRARKRAPQKIQAMYPIGSPPVTHLLRRGNHEAPGPEVAAAIPRVLAGSAGDGPQNGCTGALCAERTAADGGPRLALAQSLTAPGTRAAGLLARVIVNRVWQHHFGRGIVATPGNFGKSGEPPTHPELLEWLAADFVDGGWQLKRLHKLILMSSVYRQAASRGAPGVGPATDALSAECMAIDPDNRLLWRMPLRRLESELIRDAILAVSGRLDATVGGPPTLLEGRSDGRVMVTERGLPTPTSPWRRSLYLLARRNFNLSFLSVFDQPLMGTNCTRRSQSAVVSQSLSMLNDEFVLDAAEQLAHRAAELAGSAQNEQIQTAYRLVLTRGPSAAELQLSSEFLARQTAHYVEEAAGQLTSDQAAARSLANLCQMLLNTNEFLYVE